MSVSEQDQVNNNYADKKLENGTICSNPFNVQRVWRNMVLIAFVHLSAVYGLYLTLFGDVKLQTILFMLFLSMLSAFGVQIMS